MRLIAAVGTDPHGREALEHLQRAGIPTDTVRQDRGHPTGAAYVVVDTEGENAIVVDPGANRHLAVDAQHAASLISAGDTVLAQLEIPAQAVAPAFRAARQKQATTILNAAPAPTEWSGHLAAALAATDVLIVNSIEAGQLAALAPRQGADTEATLLALGPNTLMTTRGADGIDIAKRDGSRRRTPAPKAQAIDTTGAGDAACAGIAVAITEGSDPIAAARIGAACGSWAVRKHGTTDSYPTRQEAETFLAATQAATPDPDRPTGS